MEVVARPQFLTGRNSAERVGSGGYVLATGISEGIVELALQLARERGLKQIETRAMDGEKLEVPDASFEYAPCRSPCEWTVPPSTCGSREKPLTDELENAEGRTSFPVSRSTLCRRPRATATALRQKKGCLYQTWCCAKRCCWRRLRGIFQHR